MGMSGGSKERSVSRRLLLKTTVAGVAGQRLSSAQTSPPSETPSLLAEARESDRAHAAELSKEALAPSVEPAFAFKA